MPFDGVICNVFVFTCLLVIYKHLYSLTGEGNGTPLQYSCLENPMDRGAWWAAVHGVTRSRTRLSDFTSTFHFHALEEEMATHSSVLGWRIPGTGEPGGLPSMGLHRVGHDWSDLAAAAAACQKDTGKTKGHRETQRGSDWLRMVKCKLWEYELQKYGLKLTSS